MAGLELLALFVFVPAAGWGLELSVLRRLVTSVRRDLPSAPKLPTSRALALVGQEAVAVFLGLVLWLVFQPIAESLNASFPSNPSLASLPFWCAVSSASATTCSALATTLMLRQRFRPMLGRDFARIFAVLIIPFTAVVFALVVSFLLAGELNSLPTSGTVPSAAATTAAISALQAFSLGAIGYPVAAATANRVQDFSRRGFSRLLSIVCAGEFPLLFGLILVFSAFNALS